MSREYKVKASICVVTYNHEAYIKECLQSLVDQDADFRYEIIVGDDCSTDRTREVIMYFSEAYPDIVKPIINDINLGPTKNYFRVHGEAQGDYVFHMDGDDLAYPGKLKAQVDYLDSNPGVICCWHQARVFSDQGRVYGIREKNLDEIVDPENIGLSDFLKYGVLGCHSSLAYRKGSLSGIEILSDEVLDYYISIHFLSQGNGANLKKVLGAYRLNHDVATASGKKSVLIRRSPAKKLYLSHLKVFARRYPEFSDSIFFNSFYNFLVELKKLRINLAMSFLSLALENASKKSVRAFITDLLRFRRSLK